MSFRAFIKAAGALVPALGICLAAGDGDASVHVGRRGPGHVSRTVKQTTSPAPPAYTPAGMEFQRDTTFGAAATLNVGSPTTILMSFWIWDGYTSTNVDGNLQNNPSQFKTLRTSACEPGASSSGICFAWDNSAAWPQMTFASTSHTTGVRFAGVSNLGGGFSIGNWNHYLVAFNTVANKKALYVNGVDVLASGDMTVGQFDVGANVDLSNAAGFGLGNWGAANAHVYEAEVYLSTDDVVCDGTLNSPVSGCAASAPNTLSPATLAKFITGSGPGIGAGNVKPVDLGTNCTGPTGNQPLLCFHGADSTAMQTNAGTAAPAGGFSVQATATFATTFSYVNDPPYGPAGPTAHVAYQKWHTAAEGLGIMSSVPVTRGDFTVTAGDLLIAYANANDSSGTVDHGFACPTGGNNTWHAFSGAPLLTSVGSLQGIACWTIAQSGDTTGPWTITMVSSNGRQSGWSLHDYGQVSSVEAATCAAVAAGTTASSPTSTTVAAGTTIVGAIISRNGGTGTYSAPSVGNTRERTIKTGTRNQIVVWDRMNVNAGTTTKADITLGTSEATIGCALVAIPS